MDSILITGGSGYIGSVLSEYMLKRGCAVTVLDNLHYKQVSLLHLFQYDNFNFVLGDVRNTSLLKRLVEQHDVIIPLAAIVGMSACEANPDLAVAVNYGQIENIVSWISPNQKLILPNTNSQYGFSDEVITEKSPFNPLSLYARTKCDAEAKMLEGKNGVSLRLATVFGISPRMRLDLLVNDFVYKSVNDGYLVLFEPHFKRNYIHVQDMARTFDFVIENYDECQNNVFNVGLSSANMSKLELALKIQTHIPSLVIKQDEYKKDFDRRNYVISNEKLERLGWRAIYDLDYGIRQLIVGYKLIQTHNNRGFTNL